jgi:hypothetical protein
MNSDVIFGCTPIYSGGKYEDTGTETVSIAGYRSIKIKRPYVSPNFHSRRHISPIAIKQKPPKTVIGRKPRFNQTP